VPIALIAVLFGISFAGVAYVLQQAIRSGSDAYSGAYSQDVARQFEDIFLFIPPRRIVELGWTAFAVAFLFFFFLTGSLNSVRGFVVGTAVGAIFGTLALRVPVQLLLALKRRRLRRFNVQLGDTLISMSNALKAGFSITQAIETVVKDGENPIAQEFDLFLQQTRVGVNFSDAITNLEKRVGSEDLTLVVQAVETARRTGGNLTEIFEKISHTIRERQRIENRIRTLTAQGRLQGIVVGIMPLIIAVALLIVDPGLMLPFIHSTVGISVFVLVGLLILAGALVIRKIVNIDV